MVVRVRSGKEKEHRDLLAIKGVVIAWPGASRILDKLKTCPAVELVNQLAEGLGRAGPFDNQLVFFGLGIGAKAADHVEVDHGHRIGQRKKRFLVAIML